MLDALFRRAIKYIRENYGDKVKFFYDDDHLSILMYIKDEETYYKVKNIIRNIFGDSNAA